MTTNFNEAKLTKSDLRKVFMRSCTLDSAWNYERQQNLMYCYSMIPVLKRLYGKTKKKWQMRYADTWNSCHVCPIL